MRVAPGAYEPGRAERSSFVGRRRELAEVRRVLSSARLITLVGPGGVGKTRLALRAASDLARMFPDGTFVVDLAAVHAEELVALQVAATLRGRDPSGDRVTDLVAQVIADQHVLLVLDSCEHVRDAAAVVVHSLLGVCSHLSVLATSRLPLDVDGEVLLVVPPLSLAGEESPHQAVACEALQLLQQRAQAAAPSLGLTVAETPQLLEICRRLDGLPLAIELAAVRLRTLSPEEVIQRLDDRFRLLRRSGAAIPERHRTLLATMEWSYDLLAEPERWLWRRASVFAGSFDVAAAEAVCADDALPHDGVLDALTGLVDASVLAVTNQGGSSRFAMLDTVRAFGEDRLAASGEGLALRQRHRRWCSAMTESASGRFLGSDQVAAFNHLARNHHEISAALDFCAQTPAEVYAGLTMASELWLYWEARGRLTEGRTRLHALLGACPGHPARARALAVAGYLALAGTAVEVAVPLLMQARDLALANEDGRVAAMATQYLGQAALFNGEFDRADELLREAAAQHLPHDEGLAAFCWADIGIVAILQARTEDAAEAFSRSLAQNVEGNPWIRSHALWGLGLVHLARHDTQEALMAEQESLALMQDVDDVSGSALCLGALACVAAEQERWEDAGTFTGAAAMLWRSIPAETPAPVEALYRGHLELARTALGSARWSRLFDQGGALDRAAAVSRALGVKPPATLDQHPPAEVAVAPLTSRQVEVAKLVAKGLTDREIAAALVISPRTTESHVQNILTRLGMRRRTEVAAWVAHHSP